MSSRTPLLLTLLGLVAVPLLTPACGPPEDDDPFERGVDRDDDDGDDDDTPEWNPDLQTGWIEFHRANTYGETSASVSATAAFFPPTPTTARTPVPEELDLCATGVDYPDVFGVPDSEWDVGTVTLVLVDGTEEQLEWNGGAGEHQAVLPTSAWQGEQEYTVRLSGGDDVPETELTGLLGTPAALTMDDFDPLDDDGLALSWTGGNNNGHVELRLTSDPLNDEELDGQVVWIACKLRDDNQHVLDWDDLAPLDGLATTVELLRARSNPFDTLPEQPGSVLGTSTVHEEFDFPDLGDDDDDSATDDDDSAR
jgi:hypothetical protein